jgi:hypothetical protein
MDDAICKCCDGEGRILIERVGCTQGCCGNPNRDGSCCGNGVPVPYQYQDVESCGYCEGTGLAK